MRKQLRPFYSDEELRELYSKPYDHTKWEDHIHRVNATIHVANEMWIYSKEESIADLSCGDGAILNGMHLGPDVTQYRGDISSKNVPFSKVKSNRVSFTGPIEWSIKEIDKVGLFICSETLEHVKDPDSLLWEIRKKAEFLVLSTPIGEVDDKNPEHYWGWDQVGVLEMLQNAGWDPVIKCVLDPRLEKDHYTYQVWGCM